MQSQSGFSHNPGPHRGISGTAHKGLLVGRFCWARPGDPRSPLRPLVNAAASIAASECVGVEVGLDPPAGG